MYRDPKFRETLCDAVRSLEVGPAWDLRNRMGPLIRPPEGALETGLKELEPGESWAVMPRPLEGNPCLWSPGVKWDVQPGSFSHLTELFGPVLGVMPVKDLDEALEIIRRTGYGLTAGLESLDDREQAYWCERVAAGNLYVNRGTTGAVVLRQPFGGMGKSAFGPGIKAGGPNYVRPAHGLQRRRAGSRSRGRRGSGPRRVSRGPATAGSARRGLIPEGPAAGGCRPRELLCELPGGIRPHA